MAGLHVSKTNLEDLKVVIFGAGTAGTGVADQIRDAIATESGKSKEEAAKHIWYVDKPGLLLKRHGDYLFGEAAGFCGGPMRTWGFTALITERRSMSLSLSHSESSRA
ncbi:NAD-dependent malic enzyme, mitochondrial [Pseudogymnoascus destructans]|uniref:NAD-dependent malic enzyme, mitochondrial n=1 Tax=Pseudogymnoascus destructans TaxID=655981 RepID=A0A177A921_9PEZI|nr:NAD-dependent malic enzyme, mitochondrial [Pseudogymnoascus destructans]OAF58240.1 NAD-dependent malic enzyme, mitochondrial [Pseudogymnoascus destructans]